MSDDADEALVELIARVKGFGKDATKDAAAEAAPLVEQAMKATAGAGTDPYGNTWEAKRDGSPALKNAASGVTATAKGSRVVIKVSGAYAIQNNLKAHQRRGIPTKERPLPSAIVEALAEGARRAWAKEMGS